MAHFKKVTDSLFHVYEAIKIKLHFIKLKSFFKVKAPGADSEILCLYLFAKSI